MDFCDCCQNQFVKGGDKRGEEGGGGGGGVKMLETVKV